MAAVAQQPKTPSKTPSKAPQKAQAQAPQPPQEVEDTASEAQSQAESVADDAESTAEGTVDEGEGVTENAQQQATDAKEGAEQQASDAKEGAEQQATDAKDGAEQQAGDAKEGAEQQTDEKSAENEEEEKQKKEDAELADKICGLVSTCLDKVKPTLELITEALDKADRDKQNDKLDEEKLVDHVKPMIQQATDTLKECQSGIKALDPDGKLAKRAQSHAAERKATPEEYRLSDLLKELTESVEKTIKESKRRIQDMPKAKKDLAPMFDVLRDPLLQIISAVGLLLNGVLTLLSGLLGQIGLGGIVDQIANGLGLNKVISLVQHYIGGK